MEKLEKALRSQELLVPTFKIEGEFTDQFGQVKGRIKEESASELEPVPGGVFFDGYIEHPEGNFAIQSNTLEAVQLFNNIKEFVSLKTELKSLKEMVKDARAMYQAAANQWRRTSSKESEDKLHQLDVKTRDLGREYEQKEARLMSLSAAIEKYRI